MGALPKRKKSKSRAGNRLSHNAIKPKALDVCPQCRSPKMPHHACPTCGTYNGRQVIDMEKQKKPAA